MDLKRLEYFVAVVEAGGFSKAAAALHLSQSALSQQVAQLERETGHRLLTRNGRGAEATEVGLALLAHAKGIFSLADKARADLRERQKMPAGRITVGLPPRVAQALAGDLIESFRAEYPDAVISVAEALRNPRRDRSVRITSGSCALMMVAPPLIGPQLIGPQAPVFISWAARCTALRMRGYVPQRQMLPDMALSMSASLGAGLVFSNATADMIWPDWQ